jgi:hypothetical protein
VWLCALVVLMTAGCSGDPGATAPAPTAPTVQRGSADAGLVRVVSPQPTDGTHVRVQQTRLDTPGYVVVYADGSGAPGARLGASVLLPAGEHGDLDITLATPLKRSDRVFVMVHKEDTGNRSLDFPAGDAPVQQAGSVLVVGVQTEVA